MPDKTKTTLDAWEGTDVIGQQVRDLPVVLTDEECLHRGQSLGLQVRSISDLEAAQSLEMKALKQKHRADMQAAVVERDRLRDAVTDGKEPRPVTCVHLADFVRGVCHTVRVDTSETVSTRRLQSHEKQVQMATPLRVVPDPATGRLRRADGRDMDTLPFVRANHCDPLRCRQCDERHGRQHATNCALRGLGDAALVQRDQCDAQECVECGAKLGDRHADDCEHIAG